MKNLFKTMNDKNIRIQNQSAKHQYLAAAVVLLLLINYGITMGFSSPNTVLLTSDESPLPTGKLSMDEASWVASIVPIFALPGGLLYGFLSNCFGRKWPMVALSLPLTLSWLLVIYAQNVYYLYVARALQGIVDGGLLMTAPVYFVEIANDSVRGILSSCLAIGYACGILLAYTLGNYGNYYATPIFAIITATIFAVLFSMFPETPIFLVRQNQTKEAEKSIRFYRSIPKNDEESIQTEIERLKCAIGALTSKKNDDRRMKWSDFTTKPGSRAVIIGLVLVTISQLTGFTAMLAYTATIFDASGSALSPNTSAMIVGALKLCGTIIVFFLIDRIGRRFLYITSTVGAATSQIVLGVYMMLSFYGFAVEAYNSIPTISYSLCIFLSAFGIQGLPISVTAEIMPEKIKEFAVTVGVSLMTVFSFIVIKCLPIIAISIGFHGCMFIFAAVGLSGAAFIVKFLPETRGKSYEEIMESLR